jgi:hypothetical protein
MRANVHPVELQAFSSRDLRTALGTFATGVTVITTCGATDPYGMTANAFSAVAGPSTRPRLCEARFAGQRVHPSERGVRGQHLDGGAGAHLPVFCVARPDPERQRLRRNGVSHRGKRRADT